MPTLPALPSFSTSLYNCASGYLLSLDKNVLEPQRAKQHEKMVEAQKEGSIPTITVMDSLGWTAELEERARRELVATKEYWTLSKSFKMDYLNLVRTAMLYAARSPRDIAGVQTRLCFALDPRGGWKDYTPHHLKTWSRLFCDKLSQLITHQAWATSQPGGRAACLATAIRYTVILRTTDQREWDMCFTDSFLYGIQCAIKRGAPPREAHASMRASLVSNGDFVPAYHISNVFKALEEVVEESSEHIAADSLCYVTTEDLSTLIRALDGMSDPETGCVNLSIGMLHKMALAIRPNREIKPTTDELDAVHEQVMLEEYRRMLYYEHASSQNSRNVNAVDRTEPFACGPPAQLITQLRQIQLRMYNNQVMNL